MDCGAACLARGAPLAIATDDGTLYFPADGNLQLKPLFNARVRASGTVVEKHDAHFPASLNPVQGSAGLFARLGT